MWVKRAKIDLLESIHSQKTYMKNPALKLARAAVCAVGVPVFALNLAHAYTPSKDLPTIHEPFDRNPVGPVLLSSSSGTASYGYGILGNYASLGTYTAGVVKIVEGGLAFGGLANGSGRCLQIASAASATGISMICDVGKATGDTDYYYYDKLYCSYLIRYDSVPATGTTARSELRVVNPSATSTNHFGVFADSAPTGTGNAVAGAIQPALTYQSPASPTAYNYASSPTTQVLANPTSTTYMMIGRFTNVGNLLSVATTGTYTAGSETITVGAATNLAIGQLVSDGATPSSLAANTRIIAISGTTIYLNNNTLSAGTGTSLTFNYVPTDGTFTKTGTWNVSNGSVTGVALESTESPGAVAIGMLVTGTGIQAGTKVSNVSGTNITLSKTPTAAGSGGTLTFRSFAVIRATGGTNSSTITVDRNPTESIEGSLVNRILPGALLVAIPSVVAEGTYVTAIADVSSDASEYKKMRKLTLSKPLLGGMSNTAVTFNQRVGRSTLYTLSEAQFNHFTGQTGGMIETDLDNATIGTASNQVTVRIEGTPQTAGSYEFLPGRRIDIVGGGATGQSFKMDEIRYGVTFQAVTQPAVPEASSAPFLAAADFNTSPTSYADPGVYKEPTDTGFGWKSGFYQVEETAPTKGAYVTWGYGQKVTNTGGGAMLVYGRDAITSDQGTRRRPDPQVVNMAQPYTVEFDYLPALGGSLLTAWEDRIQIGADGPSGTTVNFGPNPGEAINLTWMVGAVGLAPSDRPVVAKKWFFYNFTPTIPNPDYGLPGQPATISSEKPTGNFFNAYSMVDTGIEVDNVGAIRFKIEVDAPRHVYHATIWRIDRNSGAVIATFSRRDLNFRRQAIAHTLFWGISNRAGTNRVFGMDNVKVYPGITQPDAFPVWIAGYPGTPSDRLGRNADANSDGRVNFLDFALNGNPMSGAHNPKEIHAVTELGGAKYITLTVPVRIGANFEPGTGPRVSSAVDGITYKIQGSYNMTDWTSAAAPTVVPLPEPLVTTPALSTGWEYKSFRLSSDTAEQPKAFIRAVVDNTVSP